MIWLSLLPALLDLAFTVHNILRWGIEAEDNPLWKWVHRHGGLTGIVLAFLALVTALAAVAYAYDLLPVLALIYMPPLIAHIVIIPHNIRAERR
ncbi:hypothetical protein [Oceanicaulis sp. MMSF_3324]|uniref:hypothetical protein n=1 Tax=Oceanicaulis sp. MMSF_3324 TaxID=3046702 RepID=UPI00273D0FE6|nr:hypothetical protein [Oceanicaulis sp. MMSF_3324]